MNSTPEHALGLSPHRLLGYPLAGPRPPQLATQQFAVAVSGARGLAPSGGYGLALASLAPRQEGPWGQTRSGRVGGAAGRGSFRASRMF